MSAPELAVLLRRRRGDLAFLDLRLALSQNSPTGPEWKELEAIIAKPTSSDDERGARGA